MIFFFYRKKSSKEDAFTSQASSSSSVESHQALPTATENSETIGTKCQVGTSAPESQKLEKIFQKSKKRVVKIQPDNTRANSSKKAGNAVSKSDVANKPASRPSSASLRPLSRRGDFVPAHVNAPFKTNVHVRLPSRKLNHLRKSQSVQKRSVQSNLPVSSRMEREKSLEACAFQTLPGIDSQPVTNGANKHSCTEGTTENLQGEQSETSSQISGQSAKVEERLPPQQAVEDLSLSGCLLQSESCMKDDSTQLSKSHEKPKCLKDKR